MQFERFYDLYKFVGVYLLNKTKCYTMLSKCGILFTRYHITDAEEKYEITAKKR